MRRRRILQLADDTLQNPLPRCPSEAAITRTLAVVSQRGNIDTTDYTGCSYAEDVSPIFAAEQSPVRNKQWQVVLSDE